MSAPSTKKVKWRGTESVGWLTEIEDAKLSLDSCVGGFAIASAHRGDETKTEQTSFLRTRNTCRGTKGRKKNQRRSLRHGLGSSLVPADIRRLEKIGVLTEEDLLRRKKNWTDTGPRFDCSFGLRRGYSKRILRSGKFYRRYRDVLLFDADGTTRCHSSSRFLSYDGPRLAEYLSTKR